MAMTFHAIEGKRNAEFLRSLSLSRCSLDFAYEWLGDVCNTVMFGLIVVHPEK